MELSQYYTKNNLEDNVASDIKMVDYWAEFLQIKEWYSWTDFENGRIW